MPFVLTGINGIKKILLLLRVLDISVDQKGVSLRVDVLHHDLEAVEALCLWDLDFATKTLYQILIDNAIG